VHDSDELGHRFRPARRIKLLTSGTQASRLTRDNMVASRSGTCVQKCEHEKWMVKEILPLLSELLCSIQVGSAVTRAAVDMDQIICALSYIWCRIYNLYFGCLSLLMPLLAFDLSLHEARP